MTEPNEGSRVVRYGRWVIRRRWWVLAAVVAATAVAAAGAKNLGLASNYRVYFSEDNPDLLAYEAIENIYARNDNALFVIKPRQGTVFTPQTLGAVRDLTEAAWQIPYSTRVDAITNFQHTWADGDDLVVENLLPPGPITAAAASRVRELSLNEPLLARRLISEDGTTTGVNVRINLPGESDSELLEAVNHIRALEAEYRELHPHLEIHTTGISMMNHAFAEAPMKDLPVVMPLMFLMVTITIIGFLRSAGGATATLAVIGLSVATAVGVAGHFGIRFDPTSASAPTIILTLAIADSVHILVSYFQALRRGVGKEDAIVEALNVNAQAVFLTSITTAIGFLSLNFSDSPPFRLLGNVTAFGVIVAWLYSMTVVPATLAIFPAGKTAAAEDGWLDRTIDRFSGFIVRNARPVLALSATAAVLLSAAVGRMAINDQFTEYFDERLPIRLANDFSTDNLIGLYGITYSLDSGEPQGVTSPEFLERADAFARWFEARPNVIHVNSFTEVMKRLNRNMHGDDPAYYRIPDSGDLGAQYLLLYEMSLPYGLDMNDQVDVRKQSIRMDVTYGDADVAIVERDMALATEWLRDNGTSSMQEAVGTGITRMFSQITRRNIDSMILGTVLGFGLISLILMGALGSVRMGLISLIPNLIPTAMALGVWALLVGEVGFAVSIVAGLSIGIIVDDTVHFLIKYNHARRSAGPEEAVRYAFRNVGTAIIGTTVVVASGFAMLGLSTFRVTAYMGLLTSMTVVSALIVDFFLLPSLLIAVDRRAMAGQSKRSSMMDIGTRKRRLSRVAPTVALLAGSALTSGVALAASGGTHPLSAQDAAERGREIAEEVDRRDRGWGDESNKLEMVLKNRNGDVSKRVVRRQVLETDIEGQGDKSIVVFDSPRDVNGTALLSHTHILDPDDQWLFLPALGRVKRISSANKSGPFVGSEFAFEDLVSQEVDKYRYEWLRDEPCGDLTCHVVQRTPRYENSGYTRQIVWWDDAEYRFQKVEYYDRKDSLLKTLTYHGYQEYGVRFWRPDRMTMDNHQSGKSTDLVFTDYVFAAGLQDAEFTPARLRRVR